MNVGIAEEYVELDDSIHEIRARTRLLQAAIDRMAARGGGTVRVARGSWEITTIVLRSSVRLHLDTGAVLQAARDFSLYPQFPIETGGKDESSFHLIYAVDCQNVAITGEGVVDGQDTAFWTPCENEEQRPYGIFQFFVTGRRLSPLVQLVRCSRVRVEDITIRRSPGWALHFDDCSEVQIDRVRVRSHLLGPNTDGIGISDSKDVHVRGCDLICGDDAIIIKSTKPGKTCERIVITDCIAETNCAAFGLGAEVAGIIRDIVFSNCIARASLRIIAIQLWQPGTVENVVFSNITGKTFPSPEVFCERPIYIDIQQFTRPEATLGRVRNIQFSNIVCATRGRIVMTAQDGAVLENITLRDVHLDIPEIEDPHEVVPSARSMQLSNFNPETRAARAAVVFDNVRGLRVDGLTVSWPRPAKSSVPMHALWFRNVTGAVVSAPQLTANLAGVERCVFVNTDGLVAGLNGFDAADHDSRLEIEQPEKSARRSPGKPASVSRHAETMAP